MYNAGTDNAPVSLSAKLAQRYLATTLETHVYFSNLLRGRRS